MRTALLWLLAYLAGSIPSGYLLLRATRGLDVREHGSHNVGAINVFRVGGRTLGLLTLLADVAKAVVVVVLARLAGASDAAVAAAAFLVLVGHAWSVYFVLSEGRFSEGKAVASGLGVLLALAALGAWSWWVALTPPVFWGLWLVVPRWIAGRWPCISPGTMGAVVLIPVMAWATGAGLPYRVLALAMAGLILVRHRHNIRRLLAGTEPRLGEAHCEGGMPPMGGDGIAVTARRFADEAVSSTTG